MSRAGRAVRNKEIKPKGRGVERIACPHCTNTYVHRKVMEKHVDKKHKAVVLLPARHVAVTSQREGGVPRVFERITGVRLTVEQNALPDTERSTQAITARTPNLAIEDTKQYTPAGTEKTNRCRNCSKAYVHQSSLDKHVRKEHGEAMAVRQASPQPESTADNIAECNMCGYECIESDIEEHMREHDFRPARELAEEREAEALAKKQRRQAQVQMLNAADAESNAQMINAQIAQSNAAPPPPPSDTVDTAQESPSFEIATVGTMKEQHDARKLLESVAQDVIIWARKEFKMNVYDVYDGFKVVPDFFIRETTFSYKPAEAKLRLNLRIAEHAEKLRRVSEEERKRVVGLEMIDKILFEGQTRLEHNLIHRFSKTRLPLNLMMVPELTMKKYVPTAPAPTPIPTRQRTPTPVFPTVPKKIVTKRSSHSSPHSTPSALALEVTQNGS